MGIATAIVVAAPIAAGTVHRVPMFVLMAAALLALGVYAAGLTLDRRALRTGPAFLIPLALTIIPLLQLIPLPVGLRGLLDRNGNELLSDNQIEQVATWPLSLDPPATGAAAGKAAAALAVALLAFHIASGKRRRHVLLRAIGLAGVAAVVIGLGHRILGFPKLYGLLDTTSRTLLSGPFVNSNHTAEFLELAAFVCLACSFQRPTALNRHGWMVGVILCAAGAIATLSRGAVAAFAMAALLFALLRYLGREDGAPGRRRASLAWGLFLLAVMFLGAGALGASQLVDRFKATAVTTDVRFQLWRQGLSVLTAHPFGIGRGAFDRVFPVYSAMKTPFPLRFAFVENEPLQLLIDSGWLLFAGLAAAAAIVVWQIARRGRRDKIEAALLAGLFAVVVHGGVDFGFETMGVAIPFLVVLACVLGRARSPHLDDDPIRPESSKKAARIWLPVAVACVGLVAGMVTLARRSSDDFDQLLKTARDTRERAALLRRAQAAHPIDYFYALAYARLLPLKPQPGERSPRMRALNRALRLCPSCEQIHVEVARNLWLMGRRGQALLEWRLAVQLQPQLFSPVMGELFAAGAKPEELAAIATFDPGRMVEVASFLSTTGHLPEAFVVLDQAEAMGAVRPELLLTRAKLQLQSGMVEPARATLKAAHAANVQDPRLAVLDAGILLNDGPQKADAALAALDAAAVRFPANLELQRVRLKVVLQYEKWQAASRAVEGLKQALHAAQGSAAEAHMAGARIETRLGHWTNALGEYRIALAQEPWNVELWLEYGRAAETAGRDAIARDAFAQASRLSPKSPEIMKALEAVDARQARLRGGLAPP